MPPVVVILWPLLLTLLLARRRWVPVVVPWILPAAAMPALFQALMPADVTTERLSWLVLGAEFGTGAGPVFLLLTGVLWLVAGGYAPAYLGDDARLRRYAFFHLLTLAGNVWLVVAQDVAGFYAGFALMTFSAYGLVVHSGTPAAWRAGRIYIGVAVFGEALLLAALLFAAAGTESWTLAELRPAVADSPWRDVIIPLALAGFGVKAGALPLHFWLPLAHPVAPTPASAVLSGVMIKAGMIGWWHVLPIGEGDFAGWGMAMMGLGLLAAFYAVACGVVQTDAKTNLAYSSVSQMGLMTAGLGAALADAELWPAAAAMLPVYALHHGLSKGALFLGVGASAAFRGRAAWQRGLVLGGLALAALSLAGAPFLAGATTKYALKDVVGPLLVPVPGGAWLLSLSSLATTLLLGRFLLIIAAGLRSGEPHPANGVVVITWILSLVAAAGGVAFALRWYAIDLHAPALGLGTLGAATWPLLAGAALLWAWHRVAVRRAEAGAAAAGASAPRVPPGDVVVAVEAALAAWVQGYRRLPPAEHWQLNVVPLIERVALSRRVQAFFNRVEIRLKRWDTAGLAMLLLLMMFWVMLR
jgi:formate hydrogenlyase subunit 3/multisubunit Na+/H+ antiporter MnhD subunit